MQLLKVIKFSLQMPFCPSGRNVNLINKCVLFQMTNLHFWHRYLCQNQPTAIDEYSESAILKFILDPLNNQQQQNQTTHIMRPSNMEYLNHPLNISKSKSAFSFRKSSRFPSQKTFSPSKYYNKPEERSRRSASIGFGTKINFAKPEFVDPGKYKIKSPFDQNLGKKGYSFGINRQEYYKGKSTVNIIGPGKYNINDSLSKRNFYMGQKITPKESNTNLSPNYYKIRDSTLNLLSNHRNAQISTRIKTEYYAKPLFHDLDNKVPGPGAYTVSQQQNMRKALVSYNRRNSPTNTTFGIGDKIKEIKSITKIGPGSYNAFSEFGRNVDLPVQK